MREGTLMESLGIEVQSVEPDLVVATMPVDHRTRQPFGILHGGASVALAETAASIGTAMQIDQARYMAVGLEINANHIRAKQSGVVTARAVPLHKGRSTMVWEIRITDEENQLVAISRCTVMIREKPTTRS